MLKNPWLSRIPKERGYAFVNQDIRQFRDHSRLKVFSISQQILSIRVGIGDGDVRTLRNRKLRASKCAVN